MFKLMLNKNLLNYSRTVLIVCDRGHVNLFDGYFEVVPRAFEYWPEATFSNTWTKFDFFLGEISAIVPLARFLRDTVYHTLAIRQLIRSVPHSTRAPFYPHSAES